MKISGTLIPFPGLQIKAISARLVGAATEQDIRQAGIELEAIYQELLNIGRKHQSFAAAEKACVEMGREDD